MVKAGATGARHFQEDAGQSAGILLLSTPAKIRVAFPKLGKDRFFQQAGFMTGSNLVVRRAEYLLLDGFDPAVAVFNDWDLFYRLVAAGLSYCVVRDPLIYWRHHGGERIASAGLRRAGGLEFFADRYAGEMPNSLRTEMLASAMSIRRRNATNVAGKIQAMAGYAQKAGVMSAVRHSLKSTLKRFNRTMVGS